MSEFMKMMIYTRSPYKGTDRTHKFVKDDDYFCKICGFNEFTGNHLKTAVLSEKKDEKYEKGQFWKEAMEYQGMKIDITSKLNKSKDFGYSVRAANKRLDKPIDPYPELNRFYVYSNSKKKWYIFKRDI